MEQYTVIHDRTNASEHPLSSGISNIYTARAESNEQYTPVPENGVAAPAGTAPVSPAYVSSAPVTPIAQIVTPVYSVSAPAPVYNAATPTAPVYNAATPTAPAYSAAARTVKIRDIMAYLTGAYPPDYTFNEAASNYGDITTY